MVLVDQFNRQTLLKTNTINEVVILKNFLAAVTPKMHKVRRALFTITVNKLPMLKTQHPNVIIST
jgi:hypothetical protein